MKLTSALITVCLLMCPLQLLAHSKLVSSQPADQAKLDSPPQEVVLEFHNPVRLIKLKIIKDNIPIDAGYKPRRDDDTIFKVAVPQLENGEYQVTWVAMGRDSHKMKGEFIFSLNVE